MSLSERLLGPRRKTSGWKKQRWEHLADRGPIINHEEGRYLGAECYKSDWTYKKLFPMEHAPPVETQAAALPQTDIAPPASPFPSAVDSYPSTPPVMPQLMPEGSIFDFRKTMSDTEKYE